MSKSKTKVNKKGNEKQDAVARSSSADKKIKPRGKQGSPMRTMAQGQKQAPHAAGIHRQEKTLGKKASAAPPQPEQPISTPIKQIGVRARKLRSGAVTFKMQGVKFTLLPDRAASAKDTAKTYTAVNMDKGKTPGFQLDAAGKVTSLGDLIPPSFTIQTTYRVGESSTSPSGYGRGTTAEDKSAGSTSLGFHEGQHGMDAIGYVQQKPLPQFQGKVGMTKSKYLESVQEYFKALDNYLAELIQESEKHTDCVGTPDKEC